MSVSSKNYNEFVKRIRKIIIQKRKKQLFFVKELEATWVEMSKELDNIEQLTDIGVNIISERSNHDDLKWVKFSQECQDHLDYIKVNSGMSFPIGKYDCDMAKDLAEPGKIKNLIEQWWFEKDEKLGIILDVIFSSSDLFDVSYTKVSLNFGGYKYLYVQDYHIEDFIEDVNSKYVSISDVVDLHSFVNSIVKDIYNPNSCDEGVHGSQKTDVGLFVIKLK